jgi:hypothetical protein
VIFDEYHFGAWRDSAKELFEGEDWAEAKNELKAEFNPDLEGFNEELDELGEHETEFLPIITKAYLYLSGTPFKALATGEFIEEQLLNWTDTDEQRAKQLWPENHSESSTPMPRSQRCGYSPTRCPTSWSLSPAKRVRRVRPQRVHAQPQAYKPLSGIRTTCRSGSTSSAALARPPKSTT